MISADITNHEKAIADIERLLASLDKPSVAPAEMDKPIVKSNQQLERKKDAAIEMSIRDGIDYAVIEMGFGTYQIYPMSQIEKGNCKYVWRTGGSSDAG